MILHPIVSSGAQWLELDSQGPGFNSLFIMSSSYMFKVTQQTGLGGTVLSWGAADEIRGWTRFEDSLLPLRTARCLVAARTIDIL